jgi:hypothetical protein
MLWWVAEMPVGDLQLFIGLMLWALSGHHPVLCYNMRICTSDLVTNSQPSVLDILQ